MGWELDRNINDVMHGSHLGVDAHVCGNLLHDEVTEACTLAKERNPFLGNLWAEFNDWCRANRVSTSHKKFSMSNITCPTAESYPLMAGKAANTRVVLAWLTQRVVAKSQAQKPNRSQTSAV